MKNKKIIIIPLVLSLLLVSCKDNKPSTNSNSSLQSNNSSVSISTPPVSTKTQILNQLEQAIECSQFAVLMKDVNNKSSKEIFTPNYIIQNSKKSGFVTLLDVKDANQKMVYKFDLINNQIALKRAEVRYEENIRHEIRSTALLHPFIQLKNQNLDFNTYLEKNSEGYYTSNQTLIYALAASLGYENYAEQGDFPCAKLFLDDENRLSFILQTTSDYISLDDYAQGTFIEFDTAKDDTMENFIQNHTFTNPITSTILEPFTQETLSLTSNIYSYYEGDIEKDELGYSTLDVANDRLNVVIEDYGDASVAQLFLMPDQDNQAARVFLNGKNELGYEKTSKSWNEIVFPNQIITTDGFYKINDTTYRYFGNYAKEIFDCTAYVILNSIESFDLKVKDNKVISALFTFETIPNSMGNLIHYEVESLVVNYRNPQPPTPLEDLSETPAIKQSFDLLNGGTSYTVKMYDIKQPSLFTLLQVTDNAILRKEYSPKPGTTEEYDIRTTGFAKNKENKILPIVVSNDNIVRVTGDPIDNKTIQDLIGFDVSASLFKKNTRDNFYSLRCNVYDLYQHMFGGKNLKNYTYNSLVMLHDEEGKITTIKYNYSINNGLVNGSEQIDISNYGKTIIDEDISSQFANLSSFALPTTWEAETQVWEVMVEKFGEELASLVPYLYDETLAMKWQAVSTSKIFYISMEEYGLNEDPTNYMERFKELLKSTPGFVEDIDANGNTIYVYGTLLEIRVESSPCRGIFISIPE